eukprot:jgi/Mesen1/4303/ME000022S03592
MSKFKKWMEARSIDEKRDEFVDPGIRLFGHTIAIPGCEGSTGDIEREVVGGTTPSRIKSHTKKQSSSMGGATSTITSVGDEKEVSKTRKYSCGLDVMAAVAFPTESEGWQQCNEEGNGSSSGSNSGSEDGVDTRAPKVAKYSALDRCQEIAAASVDEDSGRDGGLQYPCASVLADEGSGDDSVDVAHEAGQEGADKAYGLEADPKEHDSINNHHQQQQPQPPPQQQQQQQQQELQMDQQSDGLKKPDKLVPCPRCESLETKFCYYNNYNVNQPRHFCKKCQRYWTAGGTLRNVPVGSGRRKNKNASQRGADVHVHPPSLAPYYPADKAESSLHRLNSGMGSAELDMHLGRPELRGMSAAAGYPAKVHQAALQARLSSMGGGAACLDSPGSDASGLCDSGLSSGLHREGSLHDDLASPYGPAAAAARSRHLNLHLDPLSGSASQSELDPYGMPARQLPMRGPSAWAPYPYSASWSSVGPNSSAPVPPPPAPAMGGWSNGPAGAWPPVPPSCQWTSSPQQWSNPPPWGVSPWAQSIGPAGSGAAMMGHLPSPGAHPRQTFRHPDAVLNLRRMESIVGGGVDGGAPSRSHGLLSSVKAEVAICIEIMVYITSRLRGDLF